jgi:hypothetical protein
LVSNGIDLRPRLLVGLVDDRVRETIELVDPHAGFAMRAAKLVFDEQVPNTLELCEKCLGNR